MSRRVSRRTLARKLVQKLLSEPQRSDYWMRTAAAYLVEHSMTGQASLLMNDIAHELAVQGDLLNADVTSARALPEPVVRRLTDYLKAQTGAKTVVIEQRTDPSLKGGLVVRTADSQMNVSIRSALRQLSALS